MFKLVLYPMNYMATRLCGCGNTIKRVRYDRNNCSDWCAQYFGSGGSHWDIQGQTQTLKCLWCGNHFELVYGLRCERKFCSTDCSRTAQNKKNWYEFNVCRILARHPAGLTSQEIARSMDEFDFAQNARKVGFKIRPLIKSGTVIKEPKVSTEPSKYRLAKPEAHAGVWLS